MQDFACDPIASKTILVSGCSGTHDSSGGTIEAVFTVTVDVEGKKVHTHFAQSKEPHCAFFTWFNFTKNNGFAKLIKDRTLAVSKSKTTGDDTTFCKHVCLVHCCETMKQRNKVCELPLEHWRSMGETKAVDLFHKSHCKEPHCNWNCICTGEVGVSPGNCSNESFNLHAIKGPKAVVHPSASIEALLADSLPNLMANNASQRQDPCTVEVPTSFSVLKVAVKLFMTKGQDTLQLDNDHWVANLRIDIGVPLSNERLQDNVSAELGEDEPFRHSGVDNRFVCKRLVNTSRHSCKL